MISHEKCCQSYSDISPKRTQTFEKTWNEDVAGCFSLGTSWFGDLRFYLDLDLSRRSLKVQWLTGKICWLATLKRGLTTASVEGNAYLTHASGISKITSRRVLMVGWFSSGTFYHWTDQEKTLQNQGICTWPPTFLWVLGNIKYL